MRVGSTEKDGHDTLRTKEMTEVLRRQAQFCGKVDIMFQSKQKNSSSKVVSLKMTTYYIRTCNIKVRKEIMESYNRDICGFRRATGM